LSQNKKKRTPATWGSIFRNAVARGEDHGYAASLADAWERRQAKRDFNKTKTMPLASPSEPVRSRLESDLAARSRGGARG